MRFIAMIYLLFMVMLMAKAKIYIWPQQRVGEGDTKALNLQIWQNDSRVEKICREGRKRR